MPQIISLKHAAKEQGWSIRHFDRLLRKSGIEIIKIGVKHFIRSSDLIKLDRKESNGVSKV